MSILNRNLAIQGGRPIRKEILPLYRPTIDTNDINAVVEAMSSTFVSGDGPCCREFERQLCKYIGTKYAFYTNSCTGALDVAFMIKEFPAGSEVIVPNFTYTSTALAPILNNLKVVLIDVNPENGNIDVDKIEDKITNKTVAICPVDYAGNPADMDRVNEIAQKHNLYVVHDNAQSIGATYKGKKIGTLADVSCFSFHGTKNLVTGEGGAITTNSDDLAQKIIICREKGTDKHSFISNPEKTGYYEFVAKGNSYVQSNILGALGISQLEKLDKMNLRRKEIAETYMKEFLSLENVKLPKITKHSETNWHLFYLLVPALYKNWFIEAMKAEGVIANIHYYPLHLSSYYRRMCQFSENEFTNSLKFYNSLVRIPLYSSLTNDDVMDVVKAVKKVSNALSDS